MDEKRIQQVVEVEKQAQGIYEAALREAEKLPRQAELEAQAFIEKARKNAEEEVERMMATAQAEDEAKQILAQAEAKNLSLDQQVAKSSDRAVAFILSQLVGEE
jgi:vacuolar-type H+-ATPase subunit H